MKYEFEAIGTQWIIDAELPASLDEKELHAAIQSRIEQFDSAYSRFRPDSLVTRMSQRAGSYQLLPDAKPLLDAYFRFYKATDGAVTPLIGKTLEQAGYGADYKLIPTELTSPPAWEDVLRYQFPTIELLSPALLDFGAAGKGYLIDLLSKLLASYRIDSYTIDGSGDILFHDPAGAMLQIGLENPQNTNQAIGIAKIGNQALCASAGSRRQWANFTHIINPHTKTSPENILATWTVARTGLLADGLATCLFFSAGTKLQSLFEFEYLIMYADNSVEQSPGFPAELFYKQS